MPIIRDNGQNVPFPKAPEIPTSVPRDVPALDPMHVATLKAKTDHYMLRSEDTPVPTTPDRGTIGEMAGHNPWWQNENIAQQVPPGSPPPVDTLASNLASADADAYLWGRSVISQTSVEKTLAERGNRYGDFTHHADICQSIKRVMMYNPRSGYSQLSADKQQALDVIADKIARILSGDPEYKDNWHDIQGYAKLAEDRCQ